MCSFVCVRQYFYLIYIYMRTIGDIKECSTFLSGSPLHSENRENGPKNSLSEVLPKHREFGLIK